MENCNLFYLEQATNDLKEIALYISEELKNVTAAEKLIVNILNAAENARCFPYSNPVYVPIKPLKHEYRKAIVDNFMLFYWVDEEKKIVTISRIVYAKRNLKRQMNV